MIHDGDLFDVLPMIADSSIDACVTDPPYGIGFMGKEWDTFKPGVGATRKLMHPRERIAAKIQSDNPNIDGRHRSPALSPSQIDYDYTAAGLRGFQEWTARWAAEVFRVLKPGAYIVVCGAPRSYHRMACGLEDAGFVVRDSFSWIFLSGFPKSHNFGCKCGGNPVSYDHDDAEQTAERDVRRVRDADVSTAVNVGGERGQILFDGMSEHGSSEHGPAWAEPEPCRREQPSVEGRELHRAGEGLPNGAPAGSSARTPERLRAGAHRSGGANAGPSAEAERGSASPRSRSSEQRSGQPDGLRLASGALDSGASDRRARCETCGGLTSARGLGTALKPCNEPIVIARKPFKGTVGENWIQHGTGALNIDDCRLDAGAGGYRGDEPSAKRRYSDAGGTNFSMQPGPRGGSEFGRWPANVLLESADVDSEIAPYLYCAKPSREERDMGCYDLAPKQRDDSRKEGNPGGDNPRNRGLQPRGNYHPTVKPIELMRWLVRLVTPLEGVVLDPFLGSGTTGMACVYEQRQFIGIEREAEYIEIAKRRIASVAPLFTEAV